jgi:hypothetical protein
VVQHRTAAREAAGSFVRRHGVQQAVQHPALQRLQVRIRHFEQPPAAAALGHQQAAVVLPAQRVAALPGGGQRQPPQAGGRHAQPGGERGVIGQGRQRAAFQAQRRRLHLRPPVQQVAVDARAQLRRRPGGDEACVAFHQRGQHARRHAPPVFTGQPRAAFGQRLQPGCWRGRGQPQAGAQPGGQPGRLRCAGQQRAGHGQGCQAAQAVRHRRGLGSSGR